MDTTKDKKVEENIEEKNKVRITLTSKKMKNVEAGIFTYKSLKT